MLYLRDEEEKRRFTEMELRDSERQQFMKERARIEAERAAAALRAAQARKDKAGRYAAAISGLVCQLGDHCIRVKHSLIALYGV